MIDVAIIGAGPAGLMTAIQLRRCGIAPLVLEGARLGGLLHNANLVENYPGFPQGITGPRLVKLFTAQARRLGVAVTFDEVIELDYNGKVFNLETRRDACQACLVVVASGTKPITFPQGLVPRAAQEQVFYEVLPLLGVAGRRIAIVGAGDAACDYALNLAKRNEVVILNRSAEVKCLPLLWERVSALPNVACRPRTAVTRIVRPPAGGLRIEADGPHGQTTLEADYLIGALGRLPRLDFLSASLRAKSAALEGRGVLYFVGDVKNDIFRQTAIAVGDGLLAAMKIYRRLKESS